MGSPLEKRNRTDRTETLRLSHSNGSRSPPPNYRGWRVWQESQRCQRGPCEPTTAWGDGEGNRIHLRSCVLTPYSLRRLSLRLARPAAGWLSRDFSSFPLCVSALVGRLA